MAMEYARLYFDFLESEKGQYLLEECEDHGIVCLLRLWCRAGRRYNDGFFKKNVRALEKIAGWKGEKGKFVKTLIDIDFPLLDRITENEFQLHNWLKNNPHLSEKAQAIRTERARKAGLASAKKREEEATTSQLQVNNESTPSQLNPTKPQLDSTNLTKSNLNELNKKDIVELTIDEVINSWKGLSGQNNLSLKTESYRKQIRGRISDLARDKGIKEKDEIIKAFVDIFNFMGTLANDDDYQRFTPHDWNLTTLTRPKNFMKYYDMMVCSPQLEPPRPRGRLVR